MSVAAQPIQPRRDDRRRLIWVSALVRGPAIERVAPLPVSISTNRRNAVLAPGRIPARGTFVEWLSLVDQPATRQ
jgi:hypothetical protein